MTPETRKRKRNPHEFHMNVVVFVVALAVVALAIVIVALDPTAPPDSPLVGTYVTHDLRTLTLYKGGVAAYGLAYPNWLRVYPEEWKLVGDTVVINKVDPYKIVGKKLIGTHGTDNVYVKQEVTEHPELVGSYTRGDSTVILGMDGKAVFRHAAALGPVVGPEYDWWVEYDNVMLSQAGIDPWKGLGTLDFQAKGNKLIVYGPTGHIAWVKQ